MNNKILVVGFACLSLFAAAQSSPDGSKQKSSDSTPVASPRDAASGQASGKRMHKPLTIQKVADEDVAARGVAPDKAVGKKMAADNWQAPVARSSQPQNAQAGVRVAKGDVNGDGKADVAATPNSASTVKPRDASTGQASGKRMHSDITITKQADKK
jgi:hypothetical protein